VEPLDPPQSCKAGDRVFVEGFEQMTCGRKFIQERSAKLCVIHSLSVLSCSTWWANKP